MHKPSNIIPILSLCLWFAGSGFLMWGIKFFGTERMLSRHGRIPPLDPQQAIVAGCILVILGAINYMRHLKKKET